MVLEVQDSALLNTYCSPPDEDDDDTETNLKYCQGRQRFLRQKTSYPIRLPLGGDGDLLHPAA